MSRIPLLRCPKGAGGTGLIDETVDLRDIVDAINRSGASTTSLIAILEALKSAGSLKAELVVI
jgi:flagellar P-ring protein precursor FlgI